MSIQITEFSDINAFIQARANNSDNSLFQNAVEDALLGLKNNTPLSGSAGTGDRACVIISSQLEEKLGNDPELAEELSQKIDEMCKCNGEYCRDNIVVVDKNGEIAHYCTKHDKPKEYPTKEQLKEIAKARARRKARLDAYFKLVERLSVKRKLIEQENIKRAFNKKYRYSVTKVDSIAKSILHRPSKGPEYFS